MKSLLVLCPFICVLMAEEKSYSIGNKTYYEYYNLKVNEPLEVSVPNKHVIIYNSNGSISSTTLSELNDREALTIFGSSISFIENGALCAAPNMKALYLESNGELPVLTESLLSNCETIKTFIIKGAELEPNALKHMTSLEGLHIREAKIIHLTREYLETLNELKELRLERNDIISIDPGTLCSPPKLEKLILEKNEQFPPLTKPLFEGCNHINHLEINQGYASIPVNISEDALTDFTGVKYLYINHLNISHLTLKYLETLKDLEVLSLSDCKIESIDPGTLCSPPKLKRLILSLNEQFPHLTKPLLEGCNHVEYFEINNFPPNYKYDDPNLNSSMSITEDALSDFTSLKFLEAVNLIINHLTKKYFGNMPRLEILRLYKSNTTEIDVDAFESLTNLKNLTIYESHLRNEALHSLKYLTNLEYLDFGLNDIESIDDLHFPEVKYLYVEGNSISKVDVNKIISNFPKLEMLSIYANSMPCLENKRIAEEMKEAGRSARTFVIEEDQKEDCDA